MGQLILDDDCVGNIARTNLDGYGDYSSDRIACMTARDILFTSSQSLRC